MIALLTACFGAAAANGGEWDVSHDEHLEQPSQRLFERQDGVCKPVAISGTVSRDVTFERDGFALEGTSPCRRSRAFPDVPALR